MPQHKRQHKQLVWILKRCVKTCQTLPQIHAKWCSKFFTHLKVKTNPHLGQVIKLVSTFSSLIGTIIVNIIVKEICLAYQFVIVFLLYIFFDLKLLSLQLWNFFLCKDEINSNPNIVSSLVAPSQASFVTSIKSFGQPLINQQNNSGFIMAPRLPTINYMLALAVGSLLISP